MRYLTVEEVILIHEYELKRYGGTPGIRSIELLESAVFRPQTTFGGHELYTKAFEKAASLMHSIILNHPFIDGNKRTGMLSGVVFLKANSYILSLNREKFVSVALDIANNKMDVQEIAKFLRDNGKTHKKL